MNCEFVTQNAVLLVYDELADDVRHELEQHLQRCPECAAEVERMRALRTVMALDPVLEPTPNLLAASRMRLQEALETAEQARGWRRFTFDLTHIFRKRNGLWQAYSFAAVMHEDSRTGHTGILAHLSSGEADITPVGRPSRR